MVFFISTGFDVYKINENLNKKVFEYQNNFILNILFQGKIVPGIRKFISAGETALNIPADQQCKITLKGN